MTKVFCFSFHMAVSKVLLLLLTSLLFVYDVDGGPTCSKCGCITGRSSKTARNIDCQEPDLKNDEEVPVAPRYIPKWLPVDPQGKQEFGVLSRLSQLEVTPPGIVKIMHVDTYTEPPIYGAAIEYVEGEKMSEWLKSDMLLTEDFARILLLQIAKSLQFLHQHEIILGGLEMEKFVLLTTSIDAAPTINGHVKITDFEFATIGKSEEVHGRLRYIYKRVYNKEYSYDADWWAFGVLMYRMLLGDEPFPTEKRRGTYKIKATDEEIYSFQNSKLKLDFDPKLKISENARELLQFLLDPHKEQPTEIGPDSASYVLDHKWFEETLKEVEDNNHSADKLTDEASELIKQFTNTAKMPLERQYFFNTSLLMPTLDSFIMPDKKSFIGKGSFGKVYKVQLNYRNPTAKQENQYVMKIMEADSTSNRNEIKIIRRLTSRKAKCPFIVDFIAYDQPAKPFNGNYRVVMNYMGGGNMSDLLRRTGRLTEKVAALFLAQIATAIKHFHSNNIIHRDLKPRNIVLETQKENPHLLTGRLKVIDFGLSTTKTENEILEVGTEKYFSPEIANDWEHSFEVDWWCFGVTMYVILVGRNPFADKLEITSYTDGNFGIKYPREISKDATDLISQLLNPDKTQRLQSYDKVLGHKWFQGKLKAFQALNEGKNISKFVNDEISSSNSKINLC